ncbi:MAG: TPM domain-containing protein [Sphingomonadaceae bacterium]
MVIAPETEARVAAAIAAAEAKTSGEIVCTLSLERHRYVEWVVALAAGLGFALPLVAAVLGFGPERWAAGLGIWQVEPLTDVQAVELFALAQVLVAILATLALWWSPLAQRFAPLSMRRERIHEMALKQFLARGLHLTNARTGVLIHVSVEDHVVEVIADEGIHAKVDPEVWGEAAAALLEGLKRNDAAGGFEAAIALVGDILARHFPPCPDNPDEVPNRLLIV